jgi:hypothetical protein
MDICTLSQTEPQEGVHVWISGHYVANPLDPPTLESWQCRGYIILVRPGDVSNEDVEELMYHVRLNAEVTGDYDSRLPVIFHGALSLVPGGDTYILRYDDVIIVK